MQRKLREWAGDLQLAVRALRRAPGFTIVAVGTLALAIGPCATMFSVVNAVLLHPLPYANADRLVYIAASAPGSEMPSEFGVAPEFYVEYKEASRLLENVAAYNSFTNTLRTDDRVERIPMSWATSSLFSTLGAKPILGRLPTASDDTLAAVISYRLWTNWFGRDPAVIGRSYEMAGQRRTVVGVMGPGFTFPDEKSLLWITIQIPSTGIVPGHFGAPLVARMKPGVTPDALASELTMLSKRLPARFGGSANYARLIQQHRAVVRPLADELLGPVTRPLWVLFGATAIVLLIASGLLVRSFAKLSHVDPGYDTKDIFTFQIAPEGAALTDGPSFARFDMQFMERLRALPGVQSVGLVENVPLDEGTDAASFRTEQMGGDPDAGVRLAYTFAAGDYFKTMGIDVREGRAFPSTDLAATLGTAVVSRSIRPRTRACPCR